MKGKILEQTNVMKIVYLCLNCNWRWNKEYPKRTEIREGKFTVYVKQGPTILCPNCDSNRICVERRTPVV